MASAAEGGHLVRSIAKAASDCRLVITANNRPHGHQQCIDLLSREWAPSHVFRVPRRLLYLPLRRSAQCTMAQRERVRVRPDRRRHLLPAPSRLNRVPYAPSRSTLKTPKEATSGIWRSPVLKP